jgi:Peptidase C13 family
MLRAFVLIVVGLAGDPEQSELFRKWAADLAAASERLGVSRTQIIQVGDERAATRDGIQRGFADLAQRATVDDLVMVVLFGHGTFDGRAAKFNLSGPDLTAAEFKPLVDRLRAKQVVFVNTASASGPFIEALAAPGRTIITATRSGSEQFATLFGGYFVDALTAEAADTDKNRRITMLEAFEHAKGEVGRAYEREGLLATEHALLDDGGKTAATLALGNAEGASGLPADPKLRSLHEERRDIERRLESLKLLKSGMPQPRYLAELEKLATDLARKSREIKELEGKE